MVSRRRNQVHDKRFLHAVFFFLFFFSNTIQETSRHEVSPIIYLAVYLVIFRLASKYRNTLSLFIELSVHDSLLQDCKREAPNPLDEF